MVANDLKVYFSSFEVALVQGNVDDAISYISNIKNELDENLGYLRLKKGARKP